MVRPTAAWSFQRYATYWLTDNGAAHKASTREFYQTNLTVSGDGRHRDPSDRPRAVQGRRERAPEGARRTDKGSAVLRSREGISHTLETVLSGAVDDELPDTNPAGRLGKYLRGDRRMLTTPINPYTFEETERFLRRCQQIALEYYDFFFVGFRTGLREGELRELRWNEDFAEHRLTQVHVQRNFSYPQYQEDRTRGVPPSQAAITTPKGNRDRYVDLSPQVVAVLNARRTAMREAAFAAGRPMPEWSSRRREAAA